MTQSPTFKYKNLVSSIFCFIPNYFRKGNLKTPGLSLDSILSRRGGNPGRWLKVFGGGEVFCQVAVKKLRHSGPTVAPLIWGNHFARLSVGKPQKEYQYGSVFPKPNLELTKKQRYSDKCFATDDTGNRPVLEFQASPGRHVF